MSTVWYIVINTTIANNPIRLLPPETSRMIKKKKPMPKQGMMPAIERCAAMLSGTKHSTMPATQVGNGGFSSLSSPFIVGTIQ